MTNSYYGGIGALSPWSWIKRSGWCGVPQLRHRTAPSKRSDDLNYRAWFAPLHRVWRVYVLRPPLATCTFALLCCLRFRLYLAYRLAFIFSYPCLSFPNETTPLLLHPGAANAERMSSRGVV